MPTVNSPSRSVRRWLAKWSCSQISPSIRSARSRSKRPGMKSHPGVAADMFDALAEAGVNIEIISTSSIRVSCVVRAADVERAVRVVHDRFGLAEAG